MGFLSNHDRPKSMKEPRGIDALGQDVASAYYVRVGDGLRDALQGIRAANWQLEEEIIAQLALKKQGCEALDPETAQIALEVARRAAALEHLFGVDRARRGGDVGGGRLRRRAGAAGRTAAAVVVVACDRGERCAEGEDDEISELHGNNLSD